MMKTDEKILKMTTSGLLIAAGVVISPLLRIEGMCPMAHLINIVAAVILGPWEAFMCAAIIGIIRMAVLGIPPLALTGAVFGALLSGTLYRLSKGKLIAAFLGEVIGTGIIGAIISYPVMYLLLGRTGLSWLFYVPSFIAGTLLGGSLAFVLLCSLSKSGQLGRLQQALGTPVYGYSRDVLSNSAGIAALGVLVYAAAVILLKILLRVTAPWAEMLPGILLGLFIAGALLYAFRYSGSLKGGTQNGCK